MRKRTQKLLSLALALLMCLSLFPVSAFSEEAAGAASEEDVVIEEGVTKIGEGAFQDCISLTSVEIPESVTNTKTKVIVEHSTDPHFSDVFDYKDYSIGIFQDCTGLTEVICKGSTGAYAFNGCTSLKKVNI